MLSPETVKSRLVEGNEEIICVKEHGRVCSTLEAVYRRTNRIIYILCLAPFGRDGSSASDGDRHLYHVIITTNRCYTECIDPIVWQLEQIFILFIYIIYALLQ